MMSPRIAPLFVTSMALFLGCSGDVGMDPSASSSSAQTTSPETASASATASTSETTQATGSEATDGASTGESTGVATEPTSSDTSSSTDPTTGTTTDTTTDGGTTADTDTDTDTDTGGDFCDGSGGLKVPGDDTCTGDIGKKTFLFAACSCGDVSINNKLTTDSFEMGGGSVGTNGIYKATSAVDIEGSLWSVGELSSFNLHNVSEQLQCRSTITASGTSQVGGDTFVEDDISAQNKSLTIDGDLHIPPGKTHDAVVKGAVLVEEVTVKTPCDCDDLLDIPGLVDAFSGVNNNQENGVDPDALKNTAMATTLDLPCGIYVLNEISANAATTINILGRVVLVIPGDIAASGPFTVNIADNAELDLFVAGKADFTNSIKVGDPERPAATRAYIHGSTSFAGAFEVGANIYMPNSTFTSNNSVEMWGALFVGQLDVAGPLTIHYDEDILDLDGCDEPGESCGDCHDCVNPTPACVDGECGPCQTSADCCPPLQCVDGLCETIIPG